jgi:hypothetical protein
MTGVHRYTALYCTDTLGYLEFESPLACVFKVPKVELVTFSGVNG